MKQIVFATNNKNKLREMREIMDGLYEVLSLDDIGCHEEIIEDADTIEGNAKIKADFVTNRYHIDCFADDTGLEVEALNGGFPHLHCAEPQREILLFRRPLRRTNHRAAARHRRFRLRPHLPARRL